MKMTFQVKAVLAVFLAIAAYAVLGRYGYLPGSFVPAALVPDRVELDQTVPDAPDTGVVTQVALPSTGAGKVGGPLVRVNIWAWNAQMGLIFANGGVNTTAGSLMEKAGVKVALTRQDDTNVSQAAQIKFAQALADGQDNPTDADGSTLTHFVVIMGDQAAGYIQTVNDALKKLGPDYRAEVVGHVGYSRGEDAFWGPSEWQTSPESMKGGLAATAVREGDWNIAQQYLALNGTPNNPDETTYDPDAMNWVNTTYLKAVDMLIAGYCEDRQEVKLDPATGKRKKTGKTVHKCLDAAATWTPGDVTLAKKKGGLVRLLSTKENPYQMPAVLIGIHKWNVTHTKQVEGILTAAFAGADQVKHFPAALDRAAKASFAVYNEESPAYWAKYYTGVRERDKTGNPVELGGSTVANFGDNLVFYGLTDGVSRFKQTYEGFGNILKKQYPELVASFPPAEEAFNGQFLKSLQGKLVAEAPEVETFEASGPIASTNVIAKRDWSITFDTGKATFTPGATATLDELFTLLTNSAALSVEVDGHTDNVGNSDANKALSEARAFAVKAWLEGKSATLFPTNRVSVRAFGDTAPIASNATPEGRAKNRRVTIILGTK